MTSSGLLSFSLLLSAAISCSSSEPTTIKPVASPPASPPVAAPSVAAPRAAVVPPPTPQVPEVARPAPIATADSNSDGVRVEVTQLKRISGDVVDLRFTIVNDGDTDLGFEDWYKFIPGGSAIGTTLIDLVGKKKYFVAKDSQGGCVCNGNGFLGLKRRSRVNLWARFPAPPDDVQRISIVIPNVAPIDDVPISR